MQVLKFGGTSVANADCINKAIAIIRRAAQKGRVAAVSSALGGITDSLIEAGTLAASGNESYKEKLKYVEKRHFTAIEELLPGEKGENIRNEVKGTLEDLAKLYYGVFLLKELSSRTKDSIMSFGELMSTKIVSAKLADMGVEHLWIDSRKVICTDSTFGTAVVDVEETNKRVRELVTRDTHRLYIFPGFIASDRNNETTTLGRGGSDYSASILAVATEAHSLEIWTDVSGMMTADPRMVKNSKSIPNISYKEALELSHFGAKVIYPPTIRPVVSKGIPVWIKNTFAPDDHGTLIESYPPVSDSMVRGLSNSNNIALISLEGSGMIGIPGFSHRMFGALAQANINIILITQASSVHTMCIAIEEGDAERAKKFVDTTFVYEISLGAIEPLKVETGYSIITLVGDDMKQQCGTSGRMFNALGSGKINIRAIAQGSSEKNVSTIVSSSDVKEALNIIHKEFFE
ncbi:MAG: aspartate kinase [Prevotellaceae bacterium]|jgi:aspartokinase/homoserine dehydrogenase 1|nr:aspartate kinase [Prevotellaceae bacterium]